MSDRFLDGRTAWVTGGATGIGRAIALALAGAGRRRRDRLSPRGRRACPTPPMRPARASDEIEAGADADRALRRHDASPPARPARRVPRSMPFTPRPTAALGPIDILVNAAGVSAQEAMIGHRDETWTTVIDINLNGAYRTIKRCLPGMIERALGPHRQHRLDGGRCRLSALPRLLRLQVGAARPHPLRGAGGRRARRHLQRHQPGLGRHRYDAARLAAAASPRADRGRRRGEFRPGSPTPCRRSGLIRAEEIAALAVFLCREGRFGITGEAITVSGGAPGDAALRARETPLRRLEASSRQGIDAAEQHSPADQPHQGDGRSTCRSSRRSAGPAAPTRTGRGSSSRWRPTTASRPRRDARRHRHQGADRHRDRADVSRREPLRPRAHAVEGDLRAALLRQVRQLRRRRARGRLLGPHGQGHGTCRSASCSAAGCARRSRSPPTSTTATPTARAKGASTPRTTSRARRGADSRARLHHDQVQGRGQDAGGGDRDPAGAPGALPDGQAALRPAGHLFAGDRHPHRQGDRALGSRILRGPLLGERRHGARARDASPSRSPPTCA